MKYSAEHAWVRGVGDGVLVGITPYAQAALGKVTYVDLPETGRAVAAGEALAVVESAKAASEVVCPVSGTVVAVNARLRATPALVNSDPQGEGWLVKLTGVVPAAMESLLDEAAYLALVGGR